MAKNIVIGVLKIYKKIVSPVFVVYLGGCCRFSPTCSVYAYKAIEKYGICKGGLLSIGRLFRCSLYYQYFFDPVL
jgi:putative membrane protein insertion efficiency factor